MAQDIDWEKGAFSNPAGSAEPDWESGTFSAPEKPKGYSLKDFAGDAGTVLLKGAMAVPQAAVGLADIVTGGRAGKALEDVGVRFKDANQIADTFYSDKVQSGKKAFQQAEGLSGKAAAALANPSVIATTVGESIPSMLAGGALAKGIGLAAPALAGRAGLAAAGEGIVGAGSFAENVRQQTGDGLLTPEQSGISALSGAVTGGLGALGARAGKALGVGDIDQMIANGATQGIAREGLGIANRAGRGALAEGVLEELPQSLAETALGNIALDRNVTEGMDEAAVLGTLSGGLMGGAAGALSRPAPLAAAAGGPNLNAPQGVDDAIQPVDQPGAAPIVVPPTQKPSEAMGINPAAGPLSRAAASSVDAASQPVAPTAPVAPVADAVPMEQRSLDELRQAFRSAQDPAIRKTLAAEIRKRREAMPDPLAQPQQEITLEPQANKAIKGKTPGEKAGTERAIDELASGVGGLESVGSKQSGNERARESDFLSNLSNRQSFIDKGFDDLNVDEFSVVQRLMLRTAQDDKVLKSVVELIPVDVVDMLRSQQLTPEMVFHNPSVLKSSGVRGDANNSVSIPVDGASKIVRAMASVAAKNLAVDKLPHSGGLAVNGGSAGNAVVPTSVASGFGIGDGPVSMPLFGGSTPESSGTRGVAENVRSTNDLGVVPLNGDAALIAVGGNQNNAPKDVAIINEAAQKELQATTLKPNKLKEARNARRTPDVLRGTSDTSSGAGANLSNTGMGDDVAGSARTEGAATPVISEQGQSGTGKQLSSGADALTRPNGWRSNAIKAGKVAKQLGLDPKGKRLAQIVAEIDAKDGEKSTKDRAYSLKSLAETLPDDVIGSTFGDAGYIYHSKLRPFENAQRSMLGQDVEVMSERIIRTGQPIKAEKLAELELVPVSPDARMNVAKDIATDGFFAAISKTGQITLVTPSAKNPGMFQRTIYDKKGPVSDAQHETIEDAIVSAADAGYSKQIDADRAEKLIQSSLAKANVQDTPQGTAGEATKAAPVEAREAEGGNDAASAGVPAARDGAGVQTDGVKEIVRIKDKYGRTHRVFKEDLDGGKDRIPTIRWGGDVVSGEEIPRSIINQDDSARADVGEKFKPKEKSEESQQDKSIREWTENYDRVANTDDLSTVDLKDIARAIAWASRKRQSEARKGWDGGTVNKGMLAAIDSEIERLKAEEKRRAAPGASDAQADGVKDSKRKSYSINDGKPAYLERAQKLVRDNLDGKIDQEATIRGFLDLGMTVGQARSVTAPLDWWTGSVQSDYEQRASRPKPQNQPAADGVSAQPQAAEKQAEAQQNKFAEYDAIAKQYGYEVLPDGSIGSDGKFPGVTMSIKKGRLRVEGKSGNLLGSYAPKPESLGKFLEAFWYAEKKPAKPQAAAPKEDAAKDAGDDAFMGVEQTETEAFKRWFGDSKVVDAQGKPLVVYHGTRGKFTTFDYSKIGEQGRAEGAGFYFTNSKKVASGYGQPMEVFLSIKKPLAYDAKPFSNAVVQKIVARVAELEAKDEGGDIADGFLANFGDVRSEGLRRVIKTAADMIAEDETALDQLSGIVGSGVRPQFVNQAARDVTGFDGVVADGFSNSGGSDNRIFVAFFPEQIKSATDNKGTFDSTDPDITNYGTKKARASATPVDRAVMDMAGEGREANDILRFIADASKSPFRKQLADLLVKTGANPSVSLGGDMGGGQGFKFLAKYSRKNHEVTLSEAASDRAEQIFLHETVHSATLMALDRGGQYTDQMKRLAAQVYKVASPEMRKQYGLTLKKGTNEVNVGEFVAEAFTNPEFQKQLKGIPVLGRSAWQRFVAMVRRIIGMDVKETDALTEALELGAKVMRENVALRKARSFRAEDGPAFAGEDEANFGIADAAEQLGKQAAVKPVVQALNDTFKVKGKLHWWHKTVGTPFNLAERVPEFKRVFNAVQDFINSVSFYGAEAAAMAPKIIPKLESWKDLGKSPISAEDNKAIAAPIFEGTLSWYRDPRSGKPVQTDDVGEAGIVWTDDELRSKFKLTDEQVSLYREFRAATDKSLTDLALSDLLQFAGKDAQPIKDTVMGMSLKEGAETIRDYLVSVAEFEDKGRKAMLLDTSNEVIERSKKAQRLMDKGYAPLQRFGRHTIYAKDKNGEQLFFGMYEDRRSAARAARQMREQFPSATVEVGMMSEQSYKLFQGISPETLELFGTMLGLDTQADGQENEAFQTYLKLAKSNRSALKRLIERKGISGYSEDASRVLASFIYSNARQTASNLHVGEIMNGVNDIPRDMGEAKDAAVKLARYTMDPQEEAQAIRGLLFAQYLGGSIASAAINALQPAQVTFPYLSQFVGMKRSAALMTQAVRDSLKKATGDKKLDAMLKQAEEEGIVSPQEIFQLMAQAQGKATLKAGDGTKAGDAAALASNTLSRLSLGWGKVFSIPEQFNRRTTFIAAYRAAVEKGEANPYEFAKQAVKETQLVYNKGNRPEWARGTIGALAFTFKTYSISYVELLQRMAASGPEGRRAAALMVGVLFMMAGAGGLPGVEDAEDVVDGIAQRVFGLNFQTRQLRQEWLANTFGEGAARFVENGLSGLPWSPTDVSGRLGLGNLVPGTGLFVKKQDYGRDVAELAGPAADMTRRFLEGAGYLLQGEIAKAGEIVSPVAVRNLIQGGRMAMTDQYADAKGRKVVETDATDAALKAIGFQPADVSKVQDATRTVQQMVALNKIRESEIADKWAKALATQDQEGVQEAREELANWNRRNPDSPIRINMSQVLKRVRALKEDKASRMARTAPKEIRQEVRAALEGR